MESLASLPERLKGLWNLSIKCGEFFIQMIDKGSPNSEKGPDYQVEPLLLRRAFCGVRFRKRGGARVQEIEGRDRQDVFSNEGNRGVQILPRNEPQGRNFAAPPKTNANLSLFRAFGSLRVTSGLLESLFSSDWLS